MIRILILTNIFVLSAISAFSVIVIPDTGIYIAGLLVILFIFAALYDIYNLYAEEFFSLVTVFPLMSLISFILPFHNIFYVSVFFHIGLFITASFYEIYLVKNTFNTISLQSLGICLGAAAFLFILLYFIRLVSPFAYQIKNVYFISALLLAVESGIEVFFFQGLLENQIQKFSNTFASIVFTALFFALFHYDENVIHMFFYLEFGFILSAIYMLKRDIYSVIFLQATITIGWFIITGNILI